MTEITNFLIAHGVLGMFIAAFLAGTFLPFASEVVLLGLLAAGADPVGLLIWGTIGNLLGGMFNYWIGTKGKEEWIEKYAKVKPQDLHKGLRYVRKYGAWACWPGCRSWAAYSRSRWAFFAPTSSIPRSRLPWENSPVTQ